MAQKLDVRYVQYYTGGSAARKVTPAFPSIKPAQVKRSAARKVSKIKVYIDPVALLSIFVAIVMLVSMLTGVIQLRKSQLENIRMEQVVEQLSLQNQSLRQRYEDSYDLEEVRSTALALGMVPQEQIPRITIHVPQSIPEAEPTVWQEIVTFLTGLFA